MAHLYFTDTQHQAVVATIRALIKAHGKQDSRCLAETYVFLYEFYREYGYMPTLEEMGRGLYLSAPGAKKRLDKLRRRGVIDYRKNTRLIKILALEGGYDDAAEG